MKVFITGGVFVLIVASTAAAQTGLASATSFSLKDDWELQPATDEPAAQDPMQTEFTLGPQIGFLKSRGADEGTWFAGLQARVYVADYFAVEGAVTFHQEKFLDGDIRVTEYPLQVSGLVFPFPDLKVRPYGLLGVGWYYTRVDFSGTLDGTPAETNNFYGVHLGFGAEASVSESIVLDADLRYVFISERNFEVSDKEFDFFQLTLGGNFKF